jgi:TetR/AcrR family transcriptional regulator, cholesterol catabolism regulator
MSETKDDQRKSVERRRDIIDAAIIVFAQLGYDGASLRDVADAAGMKKSNLYYYYPAKEHLLSEIVEDLHNKFNDEFLEWAASGSDPAERLKSVLVGHASLVCECYLQVRVTYENLRFLTEARRTVVIDKRHLYETRLMALMTDYLVFRTSRSAGWDLRLETRAVLGMLNWIYEWYSPKGRSSIEEISNKMAEIALRSIYLD